MLQRLTLEEINARLSAGLPMSEKIRNGIPLSREEESLRGRLWLSQDQLRLALLERGAGFAPLALEIGANFVGNEGVAGEGIALFVQDADVARRFNVAEIDKQVPLETLIPALLAMNPTPTDDDVRRHAKALAAFEALPEVEQQLREQNKRWFSLGAGWYFQEKEEELVVFLNPAEQGVDQFGWYTLAELREWGNDKGPVKNVRKYKSPV